MWCHVVNILIQFKSNIYIFCATFVMKCIWKVSNICFTHFSYQNTISDQIESRVIFFVGLGIVLVTVVIIGWRCTPPDHEPCHLLFGLGSYSMVQHRPFFGRQSRRSSRFYWVGGEGCILFHFTTNTRLFSILIHT